MLFNRPLARLLAGLTLLATSATAGFADSPITSTNFWRAYADVPEVKMANDIERLNTKLGNYLSSDKVSIDKKAAVINALSWNFHGKENATLFMEILAQKYKTQDATLIDAKLSAEDRFCLGFLTAQDDYFHVGTALKQVKKAQKSLPNSFTVAVVTGLIEAQDNFKGQKLWPYVAPVLESKKLKDDMRPAARKAIYDYMVLYKKK
jgi:hypothetical protein